MTDERIIDAEFRVVEDGRRYNRDGSYTITVNGKRRRIYEIPGTHPVERAINFVVPVAVYALTGSVISFVVHRLVWAFGWG